MSNLFKKTTFFFFCTIVSHMSFSQDATVPNEIAKKSTLMEWCLNNVFIIIAVFFMALAILTLLKTLSMLMELHRINFVKEHGLEAAIKADLAPKPSLYSRFMHAMTKSVPLEKEADLDLGHDYDGIRELDNSLPPWWVYMFYVTILFGGVYLWWYHWSDNGLNQTQSYLMEVEAGEAIKQAYLAKTAASINEKNVVALSDQTNMAAGQKIFKQYCIACHLESGGGSVGPNLTDDYWLHGGGIKNIFKTIKYGVPEKGMISWKDQLTPIDIQKVSSYIMTLHGTNPKGAKAPQGDLYKEEMKLDTTKQDSIK